MAGQIKSPVTNVLIVGVGGQGVVMVSKVLALLCQQEGYDVKQSEVHGMAKRGGAVFSHVRFGETVHSPTIPAGDVDILVSLEWAEGMRWLDQLNPNTGVFISDTHKIVPPFACRNRTRDQVPVYSRETPIEILENVTQGYALDAARIAGGLGNERAANTVLLGVMSKMLAFSEQAWLDVICDFVPANSIEINQQAFLEGRSWVATATVPDTPVAFEAPLTTGPQTRNELEITLNWCKGCDICVRMCPEKCLELDENQLVRVSLPDRCTGCRICEWLCPDFAIKLHKVPASQTQPDQLPAEA